jgi:hypothetical protein
VFEYDSGPSAVGRQIPGEYEMMFEVGLFGENPPELGRIRRLIAEVEELDPETQ